MILLNHFVLVSGETQVFKIFAFINHFGINITLSNRLLVLHAHICKSSNCHLTSTEIVFYSYLTYPIFYLVLLVCVAVYTFHASKIYKYIHIL